MAPSKPGERNTEPVPDNFVVADLPRELASEIGTTQKFAATLRSGAPQQKGKPPASPANKPAKTTLNKPVKSPRAASPAPPAEPSGLGMGNSLADRFAARQYQKMLNDANKEREKEKSTGPKHVGGDSAGQKKKTAADVFKQFSLAECDNKCGGIAETQCTECGEAFCAPCDHMLHSRPKTQSHVRQPREYPCDGKCEESRFAQRYCEECGEKFCGPCDETVHSRDKTKGHARTSLHALLAATPTPRTGGLRQVKSEEEPEKSETSQPSEPDNRSEEERRMQEMFDFYCARAPASTTLDNVKWGKAMLEVGFVDHKTVNVTDVDLIFTKVKAKGQRRLDFEGFKTGMRAVAKARFGKQFESALDPDKGVRELLKVCSGKNFSRTEEKKKIGGVFDKLTDTAHYTGAHKQRFDEDGKGLGLAGRDFAGSAMGPAHIPWEFENPSRGAEDFDGSDFAAGTSLGPHHKKKHLAGGDDSVQIYVPEKKENLQGEEGEHREVESLGTVRPGQNAHQSTMTLFSGELHVPHKGVRLNERQVPLDRPEAAGITTTKTEADIDIFHGESKHSAPAAFVRASQKDEDAPRCTVSWCTAPRASGSGFCAAHSKSH